MYIPPGFAHGFCVLSDTALFAYKCTEFYLPECEGGILWNDPDLGIQWPLTDPILSVKDSRTAPLRSVPPDRLPKYSGGES
jgi:dTDP-4-dehydrorhamnose 3,5-epimerase